MTLFSCTTIGSSIFRTSPLKVRVLLAWLTTDTHNLLCCRTNCCNFGDSFAFTAKLMAFPSASAVPCVWCYVANFHLQFHTCFFSSFLPGYGKTNDIIASQSWSGFSSLWFSYKQTERSKNEVMQADIVDQTDSKILPSIITASSGSTWKTKLW